jgi:hypothetical protein
MGKIKILLVFYVLIFSPAVSAQAGLFGAGADKEKIQVYSFIPVNKGSRDNCERMLANRRESLAAEQAYLEKLEQRYSSARNKYNYGTSKGSRILSANALRIIRVKSGIEAEKLKIFELERLIEFADAGIADEKDPRFKNYQNTALVSRKNAAISAIRSVFSSMAGQVKEGQSRGSLLKLRGRIEQEMR